MVEIFADLDTAATIGVLSWLHDPQTFAKLRNLIQNCLFLRILSVHEKLLKFMKLWIVETLFDMESERQKFVIVLADGFVVYLHIVIDGLLVAQMIVVLHLAI